MLVGQRLPKRTLAHGGLPTTWNLDPWLLGLLALVAGLYGLGLYRAWRSAGPGRAITYWRAAAFYLGMAALAASLISPLDALAEVMFSWHMLQHILLLLVAPPLLVYSALPISGLWALPDLWSRRLARTWAGRPLLRRFWSALSNPFLVWSIYAVVLWVWHTPALYQAAIADEFVHVVEHGTFLGAALLFWWTLFDAGRAGRLNPAAAVLYLFTTGLHAGWLGVLLSLSSQPWYPIYQSAADALSRPALQDQQLAGVIMWAPTAALYLLSSLGLLAFWLRLIERQAEQQFGGPT